MRETVLITGATGGIGLEMARIFAKKKYDLILVARNQERLLKIKEDFEKKYETEVRVIPADLAKEDSAEEIYGITEAEGRQIDILVNNAGCGRFGAFHEEDWEKINDMVALNLTAVMHMTRLFHSLPLAAPKEVATYAYRSLMDGKVVAIHGTGNRLSAGVLRFMPGSIVRKAVHYGLGEA